MTATEKPRTDACPHCGAEQKFPFAEENAGIHFRKFSCGFMEDSWFFYRPDLCREREARQKAEAERDEARKDLSKNLQTTGGMPWREWREECVKETLRADENLERAKKAEAEVERLRSELKSSVNLLAKFNTLRLCKTASLTQKQWDEYCRLYRNYN